MDWKKHTNREEYFIEHLRKNGINAELKKDQKLKGRYLGGYPGRNFIFEVTNLNFNRIILLTSDLGNPGRIIFSVDHFVDSIDEEHQLAKTNLRMKRSILRDTILGFDWISGKKVGSYHLPNRLCEVLNKDEKLNSYLLTRFKNTMDDIVIRPYKEERFIGIEFRGGGALTFDYLLKYTSKQDLEAYDTIAKHIKEA